ncbi:hydantoinase/oxoprolinase family protein [Methanolobus sp. ZRKC3]|uniref:hydantoinase/oxoprolinase family protein n=1 Tax=Methanolobus sp. ZRKC3 TaxID=3125786 RepID=UPI00324B1909
MKLGLGIDTGGTYTDAAIMDLSDGSLVDSNKSLTTYPDLVEGIKNTLNGLDPKYLKDISFTSVSTTLATNTTLEGKGYPAGLILIGYSISKKMPTDHVLSIGGGHDSDGNEINPLEGLEEVRDFVLENKRKVASFAISSYFGVRNPDHENRVKEYVRQLTDHPIVCGHELSTSLGAYERAVTALLNAQLIPVIDDFIKSILSVMEDAGIDSTLMMMKCDGSLVKIEEAVEKPVESIFSGPAASLVGAGHLTSFEQCVAMDVGGTSTDIAMIRDGVPQIDDQGAVVGGWNTMVKAIKMRTSAMGGDSHVWVQNKMYIGPNRVIPLCLAASEYPSMIDELENSDKYSSRIMTETLQSTTFFISKGSKAHCRALSDLDGQEMEILDAVEDYPTSIMDIAKKTEMHPLMFTHILQTLVKKRCVQQIGFTPTDALHVLGDYGRWDGRASDIGAKILSGYLNISKEEFCSNVKKGVVDNLALDLISYFADDVKTADIEKMMNCSDDMTFRIKHPVVLVGAPVGAYKADLEKTIDGDIIVPDFHEVGNAVGALVGDVIYRIELLIRPSSFGSTQYTLFSGKERRLFEDYKSAVEYGITFVEDSVSEYMKGYGLNMDKVKFELKRNDIGSMGTLPLETKIEGLAVGSPRGGA